MPEEKVHKNWLAIFALLAITFTAPATLIASQEPEQSNQAEEKKPTVIYLNGQEDEDFSTRPVPDYKNSEDWDKGEERDDFVPWVPVYEGTRHAVVGHFMFFARLFKNSKTGEALIEYSIGSDKKRIAVFLFYSTGTSKRMAIRQNDRWLWSKDKYDRDVRTGLIDFFFIELSSDYKKLVIRIVLETFQGNNFIDIVYSDNTASVDPPIETQTQPE